MEPRRSPGWSSRAFGAFGVCTARASGSTVSSELGVGTVAQHVPGVRDPLNPSSPSLGTLALSSPRPPASHVALCPLPMSHAPGERGPRSFQGHPRILARAGVHNGEWDVPSRLGPPSARFRRLLRRTCTAWREPRGAGQIVAAGTEPSRWRDRLEGERPSAYGAVRLLRRRHAAVDRVLDDQANRRGCASTAHIGKGAVMTVNVTTPADPARGDRGRDRRDGSPRGWGHREAGGRARRRSTATSSWGR